MEECKLCGSRVDLITVCKNCLTSPPTQALMAQAVNLGASYYVRSARRSKGVTQTDFGKRLGVSRASVARWEAGATKPSPLAKTKIEELLALTKQVSEGEHGKKE